MTVNKECEAEIIYLLQRGLPLQARPYAVISNAVDGLTENDILDYIKNSFEDRKARCLRGIFNLRALGYKSVLCAASIPDATLDIVAGKLIPDQGITHCYVRNCAETPRLVSGTLNHPVSFPNLWFTCTVAEAEYSKKMEEIRHLLEPHPLYILPACNQFKMEVIFDTRNQNDKAGGKAIAALEYPESDENITFSIRERKLIRALQNIPLIPEPYSKIANECCCSCDELMNILSDWRRRGILRRIGLIMCHRHIGFGANGMAVWQVAPENVQNSGKILSARKEVSHCYERLALPNFPYNVYGMIHAENRDSLNSLFLDISREIKNEKGLLFRSVHEYKKTSFQPFND
ncbi:MAG: siroheme decarboxylase subunit beta [Victivallaceae bacterium]